MKRFTTMLTVLLIGLFLLSTSVLFAQEHPEHPTKQKTEHPEHPSKASAKITKEALADAIANYVKEQAHLEGGYFMYYDAQENKPLALTLDKVHKERLAQLSDNVYFACADFKATDGHMYDLDIFMKGSDVNHLKVTQITLHKKDGKARYKWKKVGDYWKMVK